ncbi:hypothetical protein L873DRAFT_82719 [Choiromyces venosus 120613-1]|uniref:Uncharacterized protein n=1 Tax=Choiromyces venosus 120613-1 TaxID=1336337 RepID=A0A3N4J7B2_9PEZI|nr:hypothetical protein L873DRAFT_82719 [Choiromyces venosus 120613-1]
MEKVSYHSSRTQATWQEGDNKQPYQIRCFATQFLVYCSPSPVRCPLSHMLKTKLKKKKNQSPKEGHIQHTQTHNPQLFPKTSPPIPFTPRKKKKNSIPGTNTTVHSAQHTRPSNILHFHHHHPNHHPPNLLKPKTKKKKNPQARIRNQNKQDSIPKPPHEKI